MFQEISRFFAWLKNKKIVRKKEIKTN